MITTEPKLILHEWSREVRAAGVEYRVEIKERNEDEVYVAVYFWSERSYSGNEPSLGWWRFIFGHTVYREGSDLHHEVIRGCFREQRGKMRTWARSKMDNRAWAAAEKGGKRGYYTKHANSCHTTMMGYAENWRIAKAIWKELTRL